MGKDNVTRFPIKPYERLKNRLGRGAVPCQVSDRWLQFPAVASAMGDDKWMFVDVMTLSAEGEKRRKLTSLCISKKELLAALDEVR